jgi:hypothetical protein
MPKPVDIEEAQKTLRELLDQRVEVVNELLHAAQRSVELRAQADEADKETARLYQNAIRQGWTTEELRKVGLEPTGKTTSPKRRRTTTTPPTGDRRNV